MPGGVGLIAPKGTASNVFLLRIACALTLLISSWHKLWVCGYGQSKVKECFPHKKKNNNNIIIFFDWFY